MLSSLEEKKENDVKVKEKSQKWAKQQSPMLKANILLTLYIDFFGSVTSSPDILLCSASHTLTFEI